MKLVVGRKYRIVFKNENQKYLHQSVMAYLGENKALIFGHNLVFDARPVAGTQEIPLSWIADIREVKDNHPIVLNKRYP
jgi:hypothetical protein